MAKFGVEFETTVPNTCDVTIGSYHRGLQVNWLARGWKAERDASINAAWGRRGCEFVSPILDSENGGIEQAAEAAKAIAQRGGKVNASCGLHVTVEWNGDAKALARLIHLFANHEKGIYAATGTKRRERGSYAKPCKVYGNERSAKAQLDRDRFHGLNLTHVAAGRNRVEFRVFSASLNPTKIKGFIMMALALVELACDSSRRCSWDYNEKPNTKPSWKRDGVGQTELARLFYKIGWIKGKAKNAYGAPEGTNLKPVKKILAKMAKKYDEQA